MGIFPSEKGMYHYFMTNGGGIDCTDPENEQPVAAYSPLHVAGPLSFPAY